jgi:hypothetical protein
MLMLLVLNIPLLLLFDSSEPLWDFHIFIFFFRLGFFNSYFLSNHKSMSSIGLLFILTLYVYPFYIAHWAEKKSL